MPPLSNLLTTVVRGRASSPTRHYECRHCGSPAAADAEECLDEECRGGIAVYQF
jgi:hypothetical protein